MLRELCHYGWLVRDASTKRFFLGPALVGIGTTALGAVEVIDPPVSMRIRCARDDERRAEYFARCALTPDVEFEALVDQEGYVVAGHFHVPIEQVGE